MTKKKNESTLSYYKRLKTAVDSGDMDLDKAEIFELLFGETVSYDHARKSLRAFDMLLESDDNEDGEIIEDQRNKITVEIKDNLQSSSKLIKMSETDSKNPDFLLKMHGYDLDYWELVSAKSSLWSSGSSESSLYSSKISVRPKGDKEWSLEDIDTYFATRDFPKIYEQHSLTHYDETGEVLEICLPDIHFGLLSYAGECGVGENYDIKIAKERFVTCINDIINRMDGKKFSKIYLVPLGDFLHADNINNSTVKGTMVDCDGRFSKMFDYALNMMIDAIETLSHFSRVHVPYISGNHDKTRGYFLIKAIEMAFRNDDNVFIDTRPIPSKFEQFGNVLIGWSHGDAPRQNLSEWLQSHARKEFGLSKFVEIHSGHLHHQQTIEKNGMIIRHLPTICSSSSWENQQLYGKNVKTVVSFVWSEVLGLREMWFSNVL